MASAHPTAQISVPELDHDNLSRLERMYPDNLIWRWAGEPELVMQNGDKLYASCIRPKEEGECYDGVPKTSALGDQEDLLEVGDCCAFKFTSKDEQAVGMITRLCEKADSQGQLCSKRVIYKPFVKLDRLPADVVEYTKSVLLDTVGNMKLPDSLIAVSGRNGELPPGCHLPSRCTQRQPLPPIICTKEGESLHWKF